MRLVTVAALLLSLAAGGGGTAEEEGEELQPVAGSERLWEWVRSHDGVHIESGAFHVQGSLGKGKATRGVVSSRDLSAGAKIASFPLSMSFSLDTTDVSADDDDSDTCSLDRTTLDLAALLLREAALGPQSAYHPWIALLPTKEAFNLFSWDDVDKWYLSKPRLPILDEYEARLEMVASSFDSIGKTKGIAVPRGTKIDDLQWAVSIVLSRAFDITADDRRIIPGLDFFNHCSGNRSGWIRLDISNTDVELYTVYPVEKNRPLCINYAGAFSEILSSKRSFLQYGFVIPHEKKDPQASGQDNDIVDIPFSEFATPDAVRILNERGIHDNIHVRSSGVDGLSLMALRLAALDNLGFDITQRDDDISDELNKVFLEDQPINVQHEKEALDILINVTRDAMSARANALARIEKERRRRRIRKKKKKKRKRRSRHEQIIRYMLLAENDTLTRYASFISDIKKKAVESAMNGRIFTAENFRPSND